MKGDPIFQPDDKVVSFRTQYATVVQMTRVGDPSRSNKVYVVWDGSGHGEYYSSVFHLATDADA